MPSYKVLVGLDYDGKRVEAGQIVSDLPAKSIEWLLESNIIESTDSKNKSKIVEPPVVEVPEIVVEVKEETKVEDK
jgi:hypothetical protein